METTSVWTEKYRPKHFSEIKGQGDVVSKVKAFVESRNMPHLLFSGPAGVGKSSLSLVIARELFGDSWRRNFLELNASDERGIDVIRIKVKDFARTRAIGDVPFKIIFLDECDALTKEAQQALRRTMENYTTTCRFVLSCNYISKIIDPIQSRCAIFKFKPLPKEEVMKIIERIGEKEGLTIDEEARDALFEVSNGDCRRLENIMQSCAVLSKKITKKAVYSMAAMAKPESIKEIIRLALSRDFISARKMLLDVMLNEALSGLDVIKQIQSAVTGMDIDDGAKLRIIRECGEAEFRMVEGSDEYVQLESFLASIAVSGDK